MSAPAASAQRPRRPLVSAGIDAIAVVTMLAVAGAAGALLVRYRRAHRIVQPAFALAEMRVHVRVGDALILDARDPGTFAAGHIPGALNLPIANWKERSIELGEALRRSRGRLVIVYCANPWCGQAEDLQVALLDEGERHVGLFAGGFDEWRGAGLRVEISK